MYDDEMGMVIPIDILNDRGDIMRDALEKIFEQLENMTVLQDIFEALDGIEKPNLADHAQAIGWIS